MKIIAISILLMLAACASTPTTPKVTTIYVPVKEPCISKAPDRPAYRYGKGNYPGDKAAAALLAADFEAAEQYGNAWELAATGCVKTNDEGVQAQSDSSRTD